MGGRTRGARRGDDRPESRPRARRPRERERGTGQDRPAPARRAASALDVPFARQPRDERRQHEQDPHRDDHSPADLQRRRPGQRPAQRLLTEQAERDEDHREAGDEREAWADHPPGADLGRASRRRRPRYSPAPAAAHTARGTRSAPLRTPPGSDARRRVHHGPPSVATREPALRIPTEPRRPVVGLHGSAWRLRRHAPELHRRPSRRPAEGQTEPILNPATGEMIAARSAVERRGRRPRGQARPARHFRVGCARPPASARYALLKLADAIEEHARRAVRARVRQRRQADQRLPRRRDPLHGRQPALLRGRRAVPGGPRRGRVRQRLHLDHPP